MALEKNHCMKTWSRFKISIFRGSCRSGFLWYLLLQLGSARDTSRLTCWRAGHHTSWTVSRMLQVSLLPACGHRPAFRAGLRPPIIRGGSEWTGHIDWNQSHSVTTVPPESRPRWNFQIPVYCVCLHPVLLWTSGVISDHGGLWTSWLCPTRTVPHVCNCDYQGSTVE